MKPVYYLAVDIGASSGRHILASMDNGRMVLEEVYRFENGMVNTCGKKLWDVDKLYENILEGMKECKRLGKIPVSMSIDTWAVDYVLLDDNDKRIGDVYGYRDERTDGMDKEVYRLIEEGILYTRTGIQKQKFNTIYQHMADKFKRPEQLEKAKTFIMLPDYFQFMLTGVKASEYTNATSTQLVNPETKQWDYELINMLGINRDMFMELKQPGTVIGKLTESVKQKIGFNTNVVMCASHDTASAVMAVPTVSDNVLYLSSGTWSLMGTELLKARCDEKSRKCNFTNEGGYDYRFRYLKNTVGEVAAVVYKSLAGSYADTVSQIEENTDTVYEAIYVIGGGANAAYLNRLTAISTGKKVIAGPVEATAIGNAMAQMITDGIFKNLKEARACVMQSFDIRQFEKCE